MGTLPPRSPSSQPLISKAEISTVEIKRLDERIARLENSLEEIKKTLEEIKELIKNQDAIRREIFGSHRHTYKRPEKEKKFIDDKTSTPLENE